MAYGGGYPCRAASWLPASDERIMGDIRSAYLPQIDTYLPKCDIPSGARVSAIALPSVGLSLLSRINPTIRRVIRFRCIALRCVGLSGYSPTVCRGSRRMPVAVRSSRLGVGLGRWPIADLHHYGAYDPTICRVIRTDMVR